MPMALKCDVTKACRKSGMDKPIDLVHLSSLTMGDRKLELEILKMFSIQIPQYLKMVDNSNTDDEILRTAHTIKGAARSIGAFKLAELAEYTESEIQIDRDAFANEFQLIQCYISEFD